MKKQVTRPIGIFREVTHYFRAEPDFLIIGAQKSGTTSLYYDLASHPKLKPNVGPKEVNFFTKEYKKGIEYYKSYFPFKNDGKIYFQTAPYYLFHPRVPERVFIHYPNIKIIAILRNPIYRAFSHYNHERVAGKEQLSFEEALEAEEERLAGEEELLRNDPDYISKNHRRYSYVTRGIYIHQLERWLKYFSDSQILVLSSEEYNNKPENTLKKVYSFLNVDPVFPNWVHQKYVAQNNSSFLQRQISRFQTVFDRHYLSKMGLTRKINSRPYLEAISQDTKERLFHFFYPYNRALFSRISKDFGWNNSKNI